LADRKTILAAQANTAERQHAIVGIVQRSDFEQQDFHVENGQN
jgi:hypothetical protein